jgi:hypothetical protein
MVAFSIIKFYTKPMVTKRNLKVEFYDFGVRVGLNECALLHKSTEPLSCMISASSLEVSISNTCQSLSPDGVSNRTKVTFSEAKPFLQAGG